jgi:hypothetical protein
MVPVVADADTLFGGTTRGLLIHLDYGGLIRLHWSPLLLEELSRALVDTGRKADAKAARQHENLMRAALPHAEISTTEIQARFAEVGHAMRSAKDIHVAACAAAVLSGKYYPQASVVTLVTKNVRDFGVMKLADTGIVVQRPDAFLLSLLTRNPSGVASAFASLRFTLRSAPTPEQLLQRLAADGQVQTAAALHALWRDDMAEL